MYCDDCKNLVIIAYTLNKRVGHVRSFPFIAFL